MSFNKLLAGLNKKQLESVKFDTGPVLIIAGAGTGKTTVITQRIAHLISQKRAKPEEILALTFTEKAAAEMEERVDLLVPYGYVDTWIMTFHAFGDRILRENFIEAGLGTNYEVIGDIESSIIIKSILPELGLKHLYNSSNETKYIPDILNFIHELQNEAISAKQFALQIKKIRFVNKLESEKYFELSEIYEAYSQKKGNKNAIDFGDQILKAIYLLKSHPKVLKSYQQQFKYILVDEFQDTNIAQNILLNLISASKKNIMVVGDDDQAIYAWRGAAVENIIDFRKKYSEAKIIVLNANYRSSTQILDCAHKLIQNNNPNRLEQIEKIDKKLTAQKSGPMPEYIHCDNSFTEASKIVQTIKKQVGRGRKYSDFAVLFRARAHTHEIITTLQSERIPFKFPDSTGLYDRSEIRLINSFLQILTDSEDSISLFYLATSEIYGIDGSLLIPELSYARRKNISLWEALTQYGYNNLLRNNSKIEKLISDVNKYRNEINKLNAGQVIHKFLTETGYLKNLIKISESDAQAAIAIENISSYFNKIKQFLALNPETKTLEFVKDLKLMRESGENPSIAKIDPDIDAVNLMTAHSSKGLEFPVVFLISLTDDRFPTRRRSNAFEIPENIRSRKKLEDYHIQEERRLFYVGLTRAKDEVYLLSSDFYEGNTRRKKISPFIVESLGSSVSKTVNFKLADDEKLSLFDTSNINAKLEQKFFRRKFPTLNPHQIDDYLTCPKKFEYIHIFEIRIIANPAVSFGTAIHSALSYYFKNTKEGIRISFEDLIKQYEKSWNSEGFETREAEERRKKEGIQILKKSYFDEAKNPTEVIAIEKPFVFDFDGIKIRGRFDMIARSGKQDKIIDFKTSSIENVEKANKRTRDSTQMKLYALAIKKIEGKLPKVNLHFVASNTIGEYEFSKSDLEKVEETVRRVLDGLKHENFKATPGYNECRWCAYKNICPYKIKGA